MKKAKQHLEKGNEFYLNTPSIYKKALPHYLKAYDFNPDNIVLNLKIADCYINLTDLKKALKYLERVEEFEESPDPFFYYLYGRSKHLLEEWDKSIDYYKQYRKKADQSIWEKKQNIPELISQCRFGRILSNKPVNVEIENFALLNTSLTEHSPTIIGEDQLLYTARRKENLGKKDTVYDIYYEDIYIARKSNGKFSSTSALSKQINTKGHDAVIGSSPISSKIFIFRYELPGRGDIYMSLRDSNNKWLNPEPLPSPINMEGFKEVSASLTPDGKTIYFSSNRPGGFGGYDLYSYKMKGGNKWSDVRNLGHKINTPFNEDNIFIHPKGDTLLFSSQGHNSIGGYDLFWSEYNSKKKSWNKVENMGHPLNSSNNDLSIVLDSTGDRGYIASDRVGGKGKSDIYSIELKKGFWIKEDENDKKYKSLIFEADNLKDFDLYKKAIKKYKEALALKPKKKYPKNKIEEIKSILSKKNEEDNKNKEYKRLIFKADNLYDFKLYKKALSLFKKASEIKPENEYPKNKINEIKEKLSRISEQKQREQRFNAFVKKADKSFERKDYKLAKKHYQKALKIKKDARHPKEMISKIEEILSSFQVRRQKQVQNKRTNISSPNSISDSLKKIALEARRNSETKGKNINARNKQIKQYIQKSRSDKELIHIKSKLEKQKNQKEEELQLYRCKKSARKELFLKEVAESIVNMKKTAEAE